MFCGDCQFSKVIYHTEQSAFGNWYHADVECNLETICGATRVKKYKNYGSKDELTRKVRFTKCKQTQEKIQNFIDAEIRKHDKKMASLKSIQQKLIDEK